MNRSHLYVLSAVLAASGLLIFAYKALVLHFPIQPRAKTTVWTVEASIEFTGVGKSGKVSLFIPSSEGRYLIADESFLNQGFGLTTSNKDQNRRATWSARRVSGRQHLFYRAVVRESAIQDEPRKVSMPPVVRPEFEGALDVAAQSIVSDVRAKSADIESFVLALLNKLASDDPGSDVSLLLKQGPYERSKPLAIRRAELAVDLLSFANLPARVVHGIRPQRQVREAQQLVWLEVFQETKWVSYDLQRVERGVPESYLVWWRGNEPLFEVKGFERPKVSLSVDSHEEEAVTTVVATARDRTPFLDYSMFSLPIQTQLVYRVLLLIPIGAFVVVVLRNLIGIKTFGTFMPVLVALAFRETQLAAGIVLFSLLVALGLVVRFYLEHLKLLLVPRLAAVLTVVIILMAATSIFTHKLGLERGLSVALFPMVIIAMTIERMSIVWEELGANAAVRQGIGTLIVAALTYLVFTWQSLEHLMFVFPELLLVLLAANILLGRYTGYRLLELRRFKPLAQEA